MKVTLAEPASRSDWQAYAKEARAAEEAARINRRASDLPINAVVAPIVVDDPMERGAKITVFRSLRDDPLAALRSRSLIDEAQYIAGRHWQRAHHYAEVGNVKAIDPAKEAVDGGPIPQPTISDVQAKAFGDLAKARKALGMEGEALVVDVLGRCMSVRDAAMKRGLVCPQEIKYINQRFSESLELLAWVFGYINKRPEFATWLR